MDEKHKTSLLAYWHQKLDDQEAWRRQRCAFQFLSRMAEDMLAAHIVDPLEWFELTELARAALTTTKSPSLSVGDTPHPIMPSMTTMPYRSAAC